MQRTDFRDQMLRLAEGFGVTLTPQRLDALYGWFGHHPLEVLREAVTRLLCGIRYPNAEQIGAAIERELDAYGRRQAKAAPSRIAARDGPGNADLGFVRCCRKQQDMIWLGATPVDVTIVLESMRDDLSAIGRAELDAHLNDLRAFGTEWPARCHGVGEGADRRELWWEMPNGSKVPFTSPVYPHKPPTTERN